MEDKRLEVGTLSGIAKLKQELEAVRKAHTPCFDMIAAMQRDLDTAKAAHAG